MSTTSTFHGWLRAHADRRPALRAVTAWVDQDQVAAGLSDSLSQWQLHFAQRGAPFEVLEALRVAWWDYIEWRAAGAGAEPETRHRMRLLEIRLEHLAAS